MQTRELTKREWKEVLCRFAKKPIEKTVREFAKEEMVGFRALTHRLYGSSEGASARGRRGDASFGDGGAAGFSTLRALANSIPGAKLVETARAVNPESIRQLSWPDFGANPRGCPKTAEGG